MRRHLGFTAEEWAALAWHEQRAYRDGLRQEFYGQPPALSAEDGEAALRSLGVTFIHQ